MKEKGVCMKRNEFREGREGWTFSRGLAVGAHNG